MQDTFSRRARSLAGSLALLVAGCGGGGGDASGPPPLPIPSAPAAGVIGDARLPELLEWARASQNLPAMTAVLVRGGQVVERGAVGLRSNAATVKVTTEDRWHVGSITKSMTATLAALMIEEGAIGWDTTPLEVWPELDGNINAGFRNTTLRQLLSHTSGMERDVEYAGAEDSAAGTPMQKRRAWAEKALSRAPAGTAGVASYSNAAVIVAGAMLETRAGSPWEALITTRVFIPLGMTHTGFGPPGTPGALDQPFGHLSRTDGYDPVPPESANADNPKALGPAGTVNTTLDDIASFMAAHIDGERGMPGLLTPQSFTTLHTAVVPGYALGLGENPSLPPFNAHGNTHGGSNLRWLAQMWFVPSCNCAMFIATNGGGDRAEAAIQALDSLLRERIYRSL
jgi:CubicO group peptidase (beta-lactamase class C family)